MTGRPLRSQTRPSQTGSARHARLARHKINLRGPRPGPWPQSHCDGPHETQARIPGSGRGGVV